MNENVIERQKEFCQNDVHDWKYDTTKVIQERICKRCGIIHVYIAGHSGLVTMKLVDGIWKTRDE